MLGSIALAGREPGYDLRPFDPDRFTYTGAAWSNPFTAGEQTNEPGVVAGAVQY